MIHHKGMHESSLGEPVLGIVVDGESALARQFDTFIRLEARVREQFRARNHAVLLPRCGFDIGYLDVEILFQGEINSAVQG